MDLQPIKTEQDYDLALSRIEELWNSKEDSPEGDRLDILITLVGAYERVNHPTYPPDPIAAIEFHMDQNELTRADLEEYIGTRARVSEVLNGKRGLSIEMIRNLHDGLGIPSHNLAAPERASALSVPDGGCWHQ